MSVPDKCFDCVWSSDCGDKLVCMFPYCVKQTILDTKYLKMKPETEQEETEE